MNLALNYGADRIWVVNVGDLKADGVSDRVLPEHGAHAEAMG